MNYIKLIPVSLFIVILFNTCEKDDNEMPSSDTESAVYNVTYTDNTVYIDSLAAESLVRIDSADYTYYFEGSDPNISNLKVGDIILIHGIALRRVTNVTNNGSETGVETDYASLNEAIKDGEISWNKEISFNKGIIPVVQLKGKDIMLKSTFSDGYEFEEKIGEYKYRLKFIYTDSLVNVEFEITKELVKPVTARFLATGSIRNFNSKTEIKYENSKLTRFGHKNSDMKGELTLNLTVAGSGRDEITFEFPVVLFKYPVIVGGIPVFINVKVLFLMNCVVPVDGSSQVEVKFEYNSTTGIKYNGIEASADASIGNRNMSENITQTGASSAIGANFGLAFPRLEVEVLDEAIVPWIHTAFLIGGDYTFTPPCQQAKCQFIGACGINLKLLLGYSYSASKTLWQEEKVLLQAGECPEE